MAEDRFDGGDGGLLWLGADPGEDHGTRYLHIAGGTDYPMIVPAQRWPRASKGYRRHVRREKAKRLTVSR